MSKRQKFVLSSSLLAGFFLAAQLSNVFFGYGLILAVVLASLILSFWSLKEALRFDASLLALILPVAFTLGAGFFFYLLLPPSLLVRVPVIFLYALGMYAILLGANIYAVASLRTIALLRTAHAVGLVLTLLTAFFLFDSLFSFRSYPWVNGLLAGVIAWPLFLQNLWSFTLEEKITPAIWQFSIAGALVVSQLSLMISFWPVTVTVGSLFLTTILYISLGIMQAFLLGRLFNKTIREFLMVGLVVFVAVFLSARWGG